MRALSVLFGLAGLLTVAVIGCSEKQKEAARLEARMKLGDTVAPSEGGEFADSSSPGLLDTTVAQISAEISANAVVSPPDSTTPGVDAPGASDSSQPVLTDVGFGGPDTNQTSRSESSDEVLDAGAIPDEEQIKKSPAPERVATDLSAQPQGGGYVVQVSSTPDLREANALAAKFSHNGYHAFVTEVFVDGTTYFRVRIGKYATIPEAETALSELNQKFGVSGFVAQLK